MNEYIYSSLDELEKILTSSPNDKFAWKEKGVLRLEKDDKNGAISDFQKALEIDYNFIEARANIGQVKIIQGKFIEAIENFNNAISINSTFKGLHYSRANAKLKIGDANGAIEDCMKELANDEKAINCYRLMGFAKQSFENYEEALKDFLVFLKYQQSISPKDYYNIGECYYELENYSKAKAYFEKALDLMNDQPDLVLREYFGALMYEARSEFGNFGKISFNELREKIISHRKFYSLGIDAEGILLSQPTTMNQKPNYPVTEENVQALLNNYFTLFPKDDIKHVTEKIKDSEIDLNELEACAFKLSSINRIFWINKLELDKEPTQSNLLQYAIESFIRLDWDNSDKSEERLKVIEKIRKEVGISKSYKSDHLYTRDYEYDDLEDRSWSESPYYDDRLDWDQQSDEFYDDVL